MKTVTGYLLDSQNNPLVGKSVVCTLVPTTGWNKGTTQKEQFSDVFTVSTTTNSAGLYSFTLMENDLMEPAGTYYRLSFPTVASEVNISISTSTPQPATIRDVLIPGQIPPVGQTGNFVTYPAGDARYAFKGQNPVMGGPLISSDSNNVAVYGTDAGVFVSNILPGSVFKFATKAARDAALPAVSSPLGSFCVTLDTGALWELHDRLGVAKWTPPWNMPWGRVTQVGIPTVSGVTNTGTTLVDLNLTALVPPEQTNQRVLKATVKLPRLIKHDVSNIVQVNFSKTDGSIISQNILTMRAEDNTVFMYDIHLLISSLLADRILRVSLWSNVGTVDLTSSGALSIEDMGPTTYVVS